MASARKRRASITRLPCLGTGGPTGGGRDPTPEGLRSLGAPPAEAFQPKQPIGLVFRSTAAQSGRSERGKKLQGLQAADENADDVCAVW